MRSVLARLWADLSHGRNLDLYLMVFSAIAVLVLDLFGVADQGLVLSLILAVLALLAVSLLISRTLTIQLVAAVADMKQGHGLSERFFVDEDLNQVRAEVNAAQTVWLWGVTLQTAVPIFEELIRRGLTQGKIYRVLLARPDSGVTNMAALRTGNGPDDLEQHLRANLTRLKALQAGATNGSLDVRVIDYLPPYVMYVLDPHRDNGKVFARISNFGAPSEHRPTFWLENSQDALWFGRLRTEFDLAWNSAVPLEPHV